VPRAAAVAILAAAALVAGGAEARAAAAPPRAILQDDAALLYRGAAVRERTLDELRRLGVDAIRVLVVWRRYAPAPRSPRRPLDFDAGDSAAYPAGAFDALDGLVAGAAARGLDVILTPTGPGPAWASECRSGRQTCSPQPDDFRRFVAALGRRYPAVRHWAVWNEPNNPNWLTPQFAHRRPRSPALYRRLVVAAAAALKATGHGGDELLAGETAPIGGRTGRSADSPMMPGLFLRRLLCARCGRLPATGIAHHAYTRGGSQPPRSPSMRGELAISALAQVTAMVRAAGRRGVLPRAAGVHLTEGGWQTSPPDRLFGVPPAVQARWLNEAEWMVRGHPRVRSVAQYLLFDEPDTHRFQSGLRFADGRAKPALRAWRLPIWVVRRGAAVTVWGRARARLDGLPPAVEVQRRLPRSARWRTLRTLPARGDMLTTLRASHGSWRLRWGRLRSRTAGEARS
jgi:hypothetical protein